MRHNAQSVVDNHNDLSILQHNFTYNFQYTMLYFRVLKFSNISISDYPQKYLMGRCKSAWLAAEALILVPLCMSMFDWPKASGVGLRLVQFRLHRVATMVTGQGFQALPWRNYEAPRRPIDGEVNKVLLIFAGRNISQL